MNELEQMERRAYEELRRLREEFELQCEPYIKILRQIHAVRPHVSYVDGKTMIPILLPDNCPK